MTTEMKMFTGEAPAGFYRAHTGDGDPANLAEAIFPIVTHDEAGAFSLIGTGFFIAENGLFATAKHVVEHVLAEDGSPKAPLGLFHFLPGNIYIYRPVHRVTRHDVADVAVGVAHPMTHNKTGKALQNKLLTLSKRRARIALSVSTWAYPKSRIKPGSPQTLNFEGAFFDGVITQRFPNGRDSVMLPGPCFQTSMVLHGGASGGPVLAASGEVVAINSTGLGADPVSYVSCISSIMTLGLPEILIPGSDAAQRVTIGKLVELGFVCCR